MEQPLEYQGSPASLYAFDGRFSKHQKIRKRIFYVPETPIMYFKQRCRFLKYSEEGLLGGGWVCYLYIIKYIMYL
jgi:hypothetical protein